MQLSHYSQGRDNNFNLIRIIAALAVLVTHAFALVLGSGDAEPLRQQLGMTFGSIAVDIFFVTSGFLVAASLINRQNLIEFVWARALRIFPALLVMLFLTVFILGPIFSTLPIAVYFSSPETYQYLAKCMTLVFGVAYDLPGVFENNPYPHAVNGSLWSMTYEVRMYAILAITWLILRLKPSAQMAYFKKLIVVSTAIAGVYVLVDYFYWHTESHFVRLYFMFFVGASFYILRDRITLSRTLFYGLVVGLALATGSKHFFFVVYTFGIVYILFYVAYIPAGIIRNYNRLGDYSYGIYIYAFPVQQSIAAVIPGVNLVEMVLLSTLVTLVLAVLSWHLLERRALKLKERYVNLSRKGLGFFIRE